MDDPELCLHCDTPMRWGGLLCHQCTLIEEGVLAACSKCEDVVDADELVSHEDDDRCDGCRRRAKDAAKDNSDYYRRIMP